MPTDWISTGKAAKILGCSYTYVSDLVRKGQLDGRRQTTKGRYWEVNLASVEKRATFLQSLSTVEAARQMGIPASRISKLAREGKIEAIQVGRRWRIPQSTVATYKDGNGVDMTGLITAVEFAGKAGYSSHYISACANKGEFPGARIANNVPNGPQWLLREDSLAAWLTAPGRREYKRPTPPVDPEDRGDDWWPEEMLDCASKVWDASGFSGPMESDRCDPSRCPNIYLDKCLNTDDPLCGLLEAQKKARARARGA